jgi:hypothetical protein
MFMIFGSGSALAVSTQCPFKSKVASSLNICWFKMKSWNVKRHVPKKLKMFHIRLRIKNSSPLSIYRSWLFCKHRSDPPQKKKKKILILIHTSTFHHIGKKIMHKGDGSCMGKFSINRFRTFVLHI